jgi:vacuolar-type H+-ATPase subunit I/STV1
MYKFSEDIIKSVLFNEFTKIIDISNLPRYWSKEATYLYILFFPA